MNPDGTEQTNLTNSPEEPNSDPAWSPDGTKIAFSREDAESSTDVIYVMNADGSNATRLAPGLTPAFSPDGKKIAYTVRNQGNSAYAVYVMKTDGTEQTKITNGSVSAFDPAFSPDGTNIAYAGREPSSESGSSYPDHASYSIFVANVDGSKQTKLITGEGYHEGYGDPDWSPDSSLIAFNKTEAQGGRVVKEIYVMNVPGSNAHGSEQQDPIAVGYGHEGDPAFSPDGQKIVFSFSGGNESDGGIYTINADGKEQKQISTGGEYAANWGVSPDSATLPLDTTRPRIVDVSPKPRSTIGKTNPTVRATVRDNLANLSKADVRLFVNGKEVPGTKFSYDQDNDLLKYQPPKLSKGKNKIQVVAKDAAGNVGNRSWYFTIR